MAGWQEELKDRKKRELPDGRGLVVVRGGVQKVLQKSGTWGVDRSVLSPPGPSVGGGAVCHHCLPLAFGEQ